MAALARAGRADSVVLRMRAGQRQRTRAALSAMLTHTGTTGAAMMGAMPTSEPTRVAAGTTIQDAAVVNIEWIESLAGALEIYGIDGNHGGSTLLAAVEHSQLTPDLAAQLHAAGHSFRAVREVQASSTRPVGELVEEYLRDAERIAAEQGRDAARARAEARRDAESLLRRYHVTSATRVPSGFQLRVEVAAAPAR